MLKERVKKARSIVKAGLCHQVNSRAWLVPGSNGKRYLVTRRKGETIFRCDLDCGGNGLTPCKGNKRGLCYHSLAAILAGAQTKRKEVAFCETHKAAETLKNLGGKIYEVTSAQSRKSVWAVIKSNG